MVGTTPQFLYISLGPTHGVSRETVKKVSKCCVPEINNEEVSFGSYFSAKEEHSKEGFLDSYVSAAAVKS